VSSISYDIGPGRNAAVWLLLASLLVIAPPVLAQAAAPPMGSATGYVDINRPNAPHNAANATGDDIVSDGVMPVVQVGPAHDRLAGPPELISR